MNVIIFDDERRSRFLPLTFTKPVAELLTGAFSIRNRWEKILNAKTSTLTEAYLQGLFPLEISEENLLVNARVVPSVDVLNEIQKLHERERLVVGDTIIAMKLNGQELSRALQEAEVSQKVTRLQFERKIDLVTIKSAYVPIILNHVWDFFTHAPKIFSQDMDILSLNHFRNKLPSDCQLFGDQVFVHETAKIRASTVNSENGPVIIDEGAEVMEGSHLRGPLYIGPNTVVKMGCRIYGPVSLGTEVKVGGEISSSIVHSFSNKGHDGFIGQTVIGEWCNLGADTNTSNLKNDYGSVKLWDYTAEDFVDTKQQFLGLIMGDHSKCSINSMFNTGTVVGVSANVFGTGFPKKFVPSFSWGGSDGMTEFRLDKVFEVSQRMMERRKRKFGSFEKEMLTHVYQLTAEYRKKHH